MVCFRPSDTRDQLDNIVTVEPACFARRKPRGDARCVNTIVIAAAFWSAGLPSCPRMDEVTLNNHKQSPISPAFGDAGSISNNSCPALVRLSPRREAPWARWTTTCGPATANESDSQAPAAEIVKKRGEMAMSGSKILNAHIECRSEPTPYIVIVEVGMEIVQQKDEVLLLYMSGHQVRHVRMNVPHPANGTRAWQGDSVGYWRRRLLRSTFIGQEFGPLSMVDNYGTLLQRGAPCDRVTG